MLIAEIGINHNGNLGKALQLIDQAKMAGWDVVKFQKRDPDICVPEHQKSQSKFWDGQDMTYLEYKKLIEFGLDEYKIINEYCKKIGIAWTASVWDVPSAKFMMENFKNEIPFIKIPSACNLNKELADYFNTYHPDMPLIISIGMINMDEFKSMISCNMWHNLYAIFLCNSSYPAKDDELDLNMINTLYQFRDDWELDFNIGYSGHEVDLFPTLIAYSIGANIIERHITLDKNLQGSDHKASLIYDEIYKLKNDIDRINLIKGGYVLKCYPSEENIKNKLRK